jgi:hypothetical protein
MGERVTSPITPRDADEDPRACESLQTQRARLNEQLKHCQDELARRTAGDSGTSALPTERIYRLTLEQYHAIARAGIIGDDEPVELLEGWLVRKMTKHPPHVVATGLV